MSLTNMLSGSHVDVSMTPLNYLPAYPHSTKAQVSDGVRCCLFWILGGF
ncbi:Uncharacterised protein [Yersinia enterocolitica]|nr:Uncharacterised protein [Yersinia enterocolitica]